MMQRGDAISDQQVHVVAVSDDGNIQALIKTIRGVQVILDRDVAGLYGVATGALNRQVKRNEERFPEDFMFKLSAEEWNNLKCQFGISSWGGDRQLPYAFTENGIAMLSSVLRSPTAIEVNIRIMRAFSAMRRFLLANAQMFQRIETVEKRQIATDAKVDSILERLDATETPLQGVFYDGQLWDARALVLKLIQGAKRSLILIDNWATPETLDLFAKKRKGVKVTIITSASRSRRLQRGKPKMWYDLRRGNGATRRNASKTRRSPVDKGRNAFPPMRRLQQMSHNATARKPHTSPHTQPPRRTAGF